MAQKLRDSLSKLNPINAEISRRIKVKNEKKIQREFFERQRRLQKVETIKKQNKNEDKNSAISQDLLFLYPLQSKPMPSDGKENKIQYVDLSRPKKSRAYHNGYLGIDSQKDDSKSDLEFSTPVDNMRQRKKESNSGEVSKSKSVIERHIEMTIAKSKEKLANSESPMAGLKRKSANIINNSNRNFFPNMSSLPESQKSINISRESARQEDFAESFTKAPLSSTPQKVGGTLPKHRIIAYKNAEAYDSEDTGIGARRSDDIERDSYFNPFETLSAIPKIKREAFDYYDDDQNIMRRDISSHGGNGQHTVTATQFPCVLEAYSLNRDSSATFKPIPYTQQQPPSIPDEYSFPRRSSSFLNAMDDNDDYNVLDVIKDRSDKEGSILFMYDKIKQERGSSKRGSSEQKYSESDDNDDDDDRIRQEIFKQKHVYSGPIDAMVGNRSTVSLHDKDEDCIFTTENYTCQSPKTISLQVINATGQSIANEFNENGDKRNMVLNQSKSCSGNSVELKLAQSFNETLAEVMETNDDSSIISPIFKFPHSDQTLLKSNTKEPTPCMEEGREDESVVPCVISPILVNLIDEEQGEEPLAVNDTRDRIRPLVVKIEIADGSTQTDDWIKAPDDERNSSEKIDNKSVGVQTVDMCCPVCGIGLVGRVGPNIHGEVPSWPTSVPKEDGERIRDEEDDKEVHSCVMSHESRTTSLCAMEDDNRERVDDFYHIHGPAGPAQLDICARDENKVLVEAFSFEKQDTIPRDRSPENAKDKEDKTAQNVGTTEQSAVSTNTSGPLNYMQTRSKTAKATN
eukprot:gene6147-6853_t